MPRIWYITATSTRGPNAGRFSCPKAGTILENIRQGYRSNSIICPAPRAAIGGNRSILVIRYPPPLTIANRRSGRTADHIRAPMPTIVLSRRGVERSFSGVIQRPLVV